jgi:hypothetical protein
LQPVVETPCVHHINASNHVDDDQSTTHATGQCGRAFSPTDTGSHQESHGHNPGLQAGWMWRTRSQQPPMPGRSRAGSLRVSASAAAAEESRRSVAVARESLQVKAGWPAWSAIRGSPRATLYLIFVVVRTWCEMESTMEVSGHCRSVC